MDPRITLQDILLFEKLADKGFMDFNTAEADDVCTLWYVHDLSQYHSNTLKNFISANKTLIRNGHVDKKMVTFLKLVEADLKFVNQFSKKIEEVANNHHQDDSDGESHGRGRLTPAIMKILYNGVNPDWLMHQGMDMLPILCEGLDDKLQDDFINMRFWTMLQLSPHVKRSALNQLQSQLKTQKEKHQKEQVVSESLNNKIAHAVFGWMKKKND